MNSIERHLRRLIVVAVGVVLAPAFVILDYVVVSWVGSEFDRALLSKGRALVTLTKYYNETGRVELDFADEFMPEFSNDSNPEYFQLWFSDGRLLERSNTLDQKDLPHKKRSIEGEWFFDLRLPDGRNGRAIEIVFNSQIEDKETIPGNKLTGSPIMRLVVARERESLDNALLGINLSFLASVLIMLTVIVWLVKIAVRRGLLPLHQIKEQLYELNANRLHSRLTIESPPRELKPLIDQFNELLQNLEASFRREQRFSADVAHELRTPVAELRNLAEVSTRWPDDKELKERFFEDVLAASIGMQRTINNLLALARCESGKLQLEYQTIELNKAIESAWLRVQQEAKNKNLVFRLNSKKACMCHVSVNEFELILNNIFSNAVAYSNDGSEITANIEADNKFVSVTLCNRTESLASADLSLMFDRLWRKDSSRTGDCHAGLGLSLVKAYADVLKLSVAANLEEDGVFRICISGIKDMQAVNQG